MVEKDLRKTYRDQSGNVRNIKLILNQDTQSQLDNPCRYCFEDVHEYFDTGCSCISMVHRRCFQQWITVSHRLYCEICGSRFIHR